ncbi:MAG: sialidase family protein [Balneolaceae bacterium]
MQFFFIFLPLITISCGTDAESEEWNGVWQNLGLEAHEINAIDYSDAYLFVIGKEQIFRNDLSMVAKEWISLSLEINSQNSEFGDILVASEEVYAVSKNTTDYHELPENYTSLYKSIDDGESWEPIQISLEGRERPYVINRLSRNENSFYADWHFIFKSTDGKTWKNLSEGEKVGVSEFLYISKDYPNQVWTGGWTNSFSAYLAKSSDGGETWTELNENVSFNTDANANSTAIHQENERMVLVGFGGGVSLANVVRKSADGGETWNTVLEGYNIQALKNSSVQSGRVYGSGISPKGRLFVAISTDYGDNWRIEEFKESPGEVQTNEMIVTEVEGRETIFFATNKGVYSFTLED